MADTLASDKQQVKHALSVANRPEFELLKSKERFETVAKALKDGTLSSKDEVPVTHQGNEVGKISQTRQKVTLSVDRKVSPEFAEFVLNEVPGSTRSTARASDRHELKKKQEIETKQKKKAPKPAFGSPSPS